MTYYGIPQTRADGTAMAGAHPGDHDDLAAAAEDSRGAAAAAQTTANAGVTAAATAQARADAAYARSDLPAGGGPGQVLALSGSLAKVWINPPWAGGGVGMTGPAGAASTVPGPVGPVGPPGTGGGTDTNAMHLDTAGGTGPWLKGDVVVKAGQTYVAKANTSSTQAALSGDPVSAVAVTQSGGAGAQHIVTWTEPADTTGALGYDIYRKDNTGSTTVVNVTLVALGTATYTDASTQAETPFYSVGVRYGANSSIRVGPTSGGYAITLPVDAPIYPVVTPGDWAVIGNTNAPGGGAGVTPETVIGSTASLYDHPVGYWSASMFVMPGSAPLAAGNLMVKRNTIYFTPFVVPETRTYTKIGFTSTTYSVYGGGGGAVRLGIYRADPTCELGIRGLVLDAGTVSVSGTADGNYSITINQTLTPGVYYLAFLTGGDVVATGAGAIGFRSKLAQGADGARVLSTPVALAQAVLTGGLGVAYAGINPPAAFTDDPLYGRTINATYFPLPATVASTCRGAATGSDYGTAPIIQMLRSA